MQLEDIKKLADMARIDMSDEEMSEMAHDFDGILAYVGQVQEALASLPTLTKGRTEEGSINVTREDEVTHEGGEYTEKIVEQFPEKEGNYLKVKQIL